ncbi:uncharacterized protein UTRI_05366 [Ustilago trichophora]|uniref:Uncharacterized protein n=1 Tax=Ustilago trichophora TaxID=86804 RepID=A0A5C3ENI0_9BASI|nr:uncharacterized protein UTRI_05366 [Ustilago trichophora]
MDSAKIFALGLAAGLAIHVFMRNSGKPANHKEEHGGFKGQQGVSISKSAKKNKNKKKGAKDPAAAALAAPVETVNEVAKELKEAVVKEQPSVADKEATPASASKKTKNKSKATQPATPTAQEESYAAVAESTPALNNETIQAKADATQTAFTASLGDMRDADVDPLPSGYSSVARIPAPQVEAPKPKLSKREVDEGWSSVGGSSAKVNANSSASAKSNGSTTTNNGLKPSIASTNPFAALPDDATTSSVRRIPASKPSKTSAGAGWTVASSSTSKQSKNVSNGNGNLVGATETKKQRSNANKAQAKKAAKEEAEKLQAERLANHRRQQALEAANQKKAAIRPSPHSSGPTQASSKLPTAKASVDLNGRLVWD